jgi:hypothetical protein
MVRGAWVRVVAVAVLGHLVAACGTGPDVVATSAPAKVTDPYLSVKTVSGCKAGSYTGVAYTVPGDGGTAAAFLGVIDFTLVQSQRGDVLVLSDAKLTGSAGAGGEFSADVVGKQGGCSDGAFSATLVNGMFPLAPPPGSVVRFEGSIDGTYDADARTFSGGWTSNLAFPTPVVVQGRWVAGWRAAK